MALSGAGTFPTLMLLERAGLEMRGRWQELPGHIWQGGTFGGPPTDDPFLFLHLLQKFCILFSNTAPFQNELDAFSYLTTFPDLRKTVEFVGGTSLKKLL